MAFDVKVVYWRALYNYKHAVFILILIATFHSNLFSRFSVTLQYMGKHITH